jgi:polyhydroxybutyrate depolymerase
MPIECTLVGIHLKRKPPGSPSPSDGTKVTRTTYRGDAAGAEVVLVSIAGGHTWPGRAGSAALGCSTQNVSANDIIWEFFERHPMK